MPDYLLITLRKYTFMGIKTTLRHIFMWIKMLLDHTFMRIKVLECHSFMRIKVGNDVADGEKKKGKTASCQVE